MVVTYDPASLPPYAITVELTNGIWSNTSDYQIRFDGPHHFTIATNRHDLSEDRTTVIARDDGFANVLNGLEFNMIAVAMLGDQKAVFPLFGAAGVVQKFRDCTLIGVS